MQREKEETYQNLLNKVLKNPTSDDYKKLQARAPYQQFVFECSSNFYGRFQKHVIDLKLKIIATIRANWENLQEEEWRTILNCLAELQFQSQFILKEGILNMYLNILELKKEEIHENFLSELNLIISFLEETLRFYFIFRQYQEKQKKEKKQIKSFSSIKSLSQSKKKSQQKIENAEQIFNDLTKKVNSLKISDLFSEYLQQEEKDIINTHQKCRICLMNIRFDLLQKHLNYCSLKSQINQELLEIQSKGESLFEEMIENEKQMRETEIKTEKQQNLLLLFGLIEKQFLKTRKSQKKKSLIGFKKDQNSILDLRMKLEDFIDTYDLDKDHIISKLQDVLEKSQFLLKKKQNLELNYLNNVQNSNKDGSSSFNSLKELGQSLGEFRVIFSQAPKTKKSLFAKKSDSSYKSNSEKTFQDSSNNKIKKNQKLSQSLRKSKKKKVTFEVEDEGEEFYEVEQIKEEKSMYHSLFCIPIPEEDESESNICLKNFSIIKFLGKGAFGRVYLAKRKQTGNLYALKIIKIEENSEIQQINQIQNQHKIFKKIAGAHLVTAPFSFSEKMGHCFVLQFMPGGDLGKMLAENVYFQEIQAKFYLAEIILAIQHLHNFGIIHRDLKPQNLVLDEKGHLKLTDFGLSEMKIQDKIKKVKEIKDNINEVKVIEKIEQLSTKISKSKFYQKKSQIRLIGTPDYIAPQIINRISFDNMSIDWWSLGVIAYELMIGCRPFCADTIQEIIDNIKNERIEWPEIGCEEGQISQVAVDLIKKLLNANFNERLGAKGVEEIKNHPFFKGLDWQRIKYQKPPIQKKIQSLKEYDDCEEDPVLREQVQNFIKCTKKNAESQAKLQNFIRFDLLVEKTYQAAQKNLIYQGKKLNLLKRIASKFGMKKILQERRTSLQYNVDNIFDL